MSVKNIRTCLRQNLVTRFARNMLSHSLGALRDTPCFFLFRDSLHLPPAAGASEPAASCICGNTISQIRVIYKMKNKEATLKGSFFIWRLKQDSTLGLRAAVIRGSEAPLELHSLPLLLRVLYFSTIHKKDKAPTTRVGALSLAPQTGLEPVTPRLTAACSTD